MRRRLQDAFKAHKMSMIREIKIRKEACVPVQAAMRRAIASKVFTPSSRDGESPKPLLLDEALGSSGLCSKHSSRKTDEKKRREGIP